MLSASVLVGGGLNYLYQIALGRLLHPETYGAFGALFGLFYLLWIFGQSLQLHLARSTAQGRKLPIQSFWPLIWVGLGIALLVSALSIPLAHWLRLDSPLWIVWLAFTWLLCLPLPIAKGILQGRQQFAPLATLNILEPAVKLLAGIGLVSFGWGLWGAWGAWSVGALLAFFFALQALISPTSLTSAKTTRSTVFSKGHTEGGLALWVALVLAIPTNVDLLIVKATFSLHDAGLYTAAAVLGKGFLFLALGVSAVLLPKAASAANTRESKGYLTKALRVAGLLNGLGALVCALAPALLVQLLFGEAYLESAPWVRLYGLAMLAFTGVALLANYALARSLRRVLWGLAALSALEIGALVLLGASSPLQVIGILLGFHVLMLGMGAFMVLREAPRAASRRSSEEIALVSSYPPPHVKHGATGGVASYTRNLVEALTRSGCTLTVLADRISPPPIEKPQIVRCWNPGLRYVWQVWREVRRRRPAVVHLQHEFFLFGSGLSALLFPLLLLLLRPLTRTVVTLHGVLPLSKLSRTFLQENGLSGHPWLLRSGLFWLIRGIVASAHGVIVHEERLKEYLISEYRCRSPKIAVVPHGLELCTMDHSIEEAKQELGLSGKRVLLFFGYLTGYKGIELLLEGFAKVASAHPDWVLLVAGGPHPRRRDEPSYKAYVQEIEARVRGLSSQARLLGFVPEEKLSSVFLAADLVVFPYRELIASSGPLALTMSYDRPFLASEAFSGVLDARLLFRLDPSALGSKIEEFFASRELAELARQQAAAWRAIRHWDRVAQATSTLYQNLRPEGVGWSNEAVREEYWELGQTLS